MLLSLIACALQGCAPVLVAGGATAAVAATDRRTIGSFVDDQAIELKAKAAVNDDKSLAESVHINFTSMNGIMLLTGEAATTEARDRVLALVRSVAGVRRIVNEIEISGLSSFGSRSNDSWLTTKVKTNLFADRRIEGSHVKVITENSVVYLLGLVTRAEGDTATEIARATGGVRRVVKVFEYLD